MFLFSQGKNESVEKNSVSWLQKGDRGVGNMEWLEKNREQVNIYLVIKGQSPRGKTLKIDDQMRVDDSWNNNSKSQIEGLKGL